MQQHYALWNRAVGILETAPQPERFNHLLINQKRTLLAYLGRMANAEWLRETALHICAEKMSAQEAIRFIVAVRGLPWRQLTLAEKLRRTIERHCKAHPATTDSEISLQLFAVAFDFENKQKAAPMERAA
jgi:hypothetical protein